MEIVKVQIPLAPSGGPALVYAEGRKNVEFKHRLPDHVAAELLGCPRAFFEGEWDANAMRWKLGKKVEDQSW